MKKRIDIGNGIIRQLHGKKYKSFDSFNHQANKIENECFQKHSQNIVRNY